MATLSLNIDARGATTGAKQFQTATNNVKTSATQAATATGGLGSAMQRMGNMSGAQRFVFQNTANQLGDIAVQASMGTNMFRVLGMQLPQIAGGFAILGGAMGTVMPIIGVLAAVGFPLIAVFSQLSSGAKSLSDQLDGLSDNVRSAREQLDILTTPLHKLTIQFGKAAESAREFARAEAEIQLMAARDAISNIGQELQGLIKNFAEYGDRGNRAGVKVTRSMRELGKQFGLTKDQTDQLSAQFDKLSDNLKSGDVDLVALNKDGTDLLKMFTNMNISMKDLSDAGVQTFVQGLIDLGFESARVQNLMEQLDDQNKNIAKTLKTEIRVAVERSTFEIMRFGDGLDTLVRLTPEVLSSVSAMTKEFEMFGDGLDTLPDPFEKTRKSVVDVTKDIMMFGDGLEDAFVVPEEKATSSIKKISRAIKNEITPEMQRSLDLADAMGDAFENALMSAIDGTMSAKDAFRAMASDIIKELYRIFVVKQVTGFISDAISLFSGGSAFGLGSASTRPAPDIPITGNSAYGGPVSPSNGVVVGERGPEVFYPNTRGVIAPNSQVSGGNVIVNQTINVSTGVQQTVRTEIKSLMPQIAESAKAAVADAKRRGGSYGRAFA